MEAQSTILIVDDEHANRETLQALLSPGGYIFFAASDGPEGLRLAKEHLPDLVLLDVMMPGMDGFETCRQLRADPALSEVPVVIVTALDDRASRLQGIEAGADDFVAKPLDRTELRLRVKTILRLNRFRRLLHERERFQRLFELSPDGIFIVDKSGVIQLANPALNQLLRMDSGAGIQGRNVMEFVVAEQVSHCQQCFGRLLGGNVSTLTVETWFVRSNGRAFPVEVHAARFEWQGETAAQILIRDISDRRRHERKVVEAVENERRRVAMELHDDVGQLLTGIKLMLRQANGADGAAVREAGEQVDVLL